VHGWVLWAAWSVMGFTIIFSARYMKQYPKVSLYIHSIVGSVVFILNLIFGVGGLLFKNWKVSFTVHEVLGTLFAFLMTVNVLMQVATQLLLRNVRWNSTLLSTAINFHKVRKYTYTIIVTLLCVTLLGARCYRWRHPLLLQDLPRPGRPRPRRAIFLPNLC
jgi:hypothetical protein